MLRKRVRTFSFFELALCLLLQGAKIEPVGTCCKSTQWYHTSLITTILFHEYFVIVMDKLFQVWLTLVHCSRYITPEDIKTNISWKGLNKCNYLDIQNISRWRHQLFCQIAILMKIKAISALYLWFAYPGNIFYWITYP